MKICFPPNSFISGKQRTFFHHNPLNCPLVDTPAVANAAAVVVPLAEPDAAAPVLADEHVAVQLEPDEQHEHEQQPEPDDLGLLREALPTDQGSDVAGTGPCDRPVARKVS